MLNKEDIGLKFLLGLSVPIEGIGGLKSPLLRDVVDMGQEFYMLTLTTLLFDKSKANLDPDYIARRSDFEILTDGIRDDASFREVFFYGLWLHFGKTPMLNDEGFVCFDEDDEYSVLDEEKFNQLKYLIRIANNLKDQEDEQYDAANEAARKLIEKIKKNKAEAPVVQKPQPVNLHSIVSAVGWKAESFEIVNQLNMYQLYDGYYRLGFLDNYHYTMTGIYAGTIDQKKIKLSDINWANIIK